MVKSVLVSVARWKVFPKYKLRKRWTKKYMVGIIQQTQHAWKAMWSYMAVFVDHAQYVDYEAAAALRYSWAAGTFTHPKFLGQQYTVTLTELEVNVGA